MDDRYEDAAAEVAAEMSDAGRLPCPCGAPEDIELGWSGEGDDRAGECEFCGVAVVIEAGPTIWRLVGNDLERVCEDLGLDPLKWDGSVEWIGDGWRVSDATGPHDMLLVGCRRHAIAAAFARLGRLERHLGYRELHELLELADTLTDSAERRARGYTIGLEWDLPEVGR